ncbi:hypothetical protein U1Q18_032141 [Sarracenia purpurea var. burkii]
MGFSSGRTMMVGVKLDPQSRDLQTWALVKVAQPGDHVIIVQGLSKNEIVDRNRKSSLLSLVKAFDSVLAVYDDFRNLKQVDPKLKVSRAGSEASRLATNPSYIRLCRYNSLGCVEFQANAVKILGQLTIIEFLNKCSIKKQTKKNETVNIASETFSKDGDMNDGLPPPNFDHFQKYNSLIVKALHESSPLAVKLEALQCIYKSCEGVIDLRDEFGYVAVVGNLVCTVLDVASHREPKLRFPIASILKQLLWANLIHPTHLYVIGDPDNERKH